MYTALRKRVRRLKQNGANYSSVARAADLNTARLMQFVQGTDTALTIKQITRLEKVVN